MMELGCLHMQSRRKWSRWHTACKWMPQG